MILCHKDTVSMIQIKLFLNYNAFAWLMLFKEFSKKSPFVGK